MMIRKTEADSRLLFCACFALVLMASPAPALEWRGSYDYSSNAFVTLTTELRSQGFRPISVDGNGAVGNEHIASAWVKDGFTNWAMKVGMTSRDYESALTNYSAQGYRVLCIDAYDTYPTERYVAVWVKDGMIAATTNRLTSAQYQTAFTNFLALDYRPTWVSANGSGTNLYFAAVWVKDGKPSIGRHNMSAADYQAFLDSYQGSGYRPVSVAGYGAIDSPQFGALWLTEEQPEWAAFNEQSSFAFAATYSSQSSNGFRPTVITEFGSTADPRYASIWQKDPPPRVWQMTGVAPSSLTAVERAMTNYMQVRNISRGSLAVTKDGRLVFSRAYTWAPTNTPPTTPTNLFRIASLSKPITAVVVLQLIESGQLGIDQKIDTILNLTNAADAHFRDVTVRQLLQHRGGWDRAVSFDPMFYDFKITKALHVPLPTTPEMVLDFMKTQPLDFTPGERYAYSNFGYLLLGRVIERVTGLTYEQYVQNHVLAPLGILDMRVGQSLLANKLPAEVDYDDPLRRVVSSVMGTGSPRRVPLQYGGWNIATMDAHGGWLASAPDLVRFLSAFDTRTNSPLLSAASVDLMWSRPPGQNTTDKHYYAAGWDVRPIANPPGTLDASHSGLLDGTFTYFVRRHDGINWAALFNKSPSAPNAPSYNAINFEINNAANSVANWAANKLFDEEGDTNRLGNGSAESATDALPGTGRQFYRSQVKLRKP